MTKEQLKKQLETKQELLAFHMERSQDLEMQIHKIQVELNTADPDICLSCGA